MLERKDLSRGNRGIATLALAEILAGKYDRIESREYGPPSTGFAKYAEGRTAPDWGKDLVSSNSSKVRAESIELFHDVLANYADVEITVSVASFRHIKKLSEKATKSLHALEHLTVGSPAPGIMGKDLRGRPLELSAYRGKTVVLSFWFTGCGPCMAMVPQERRLVKQYEGRPFALLSICGDESLETAQKTAAEHKMDWPCWFDGGNGPIARDWNVLSWPMIYILNEKGVIVCKLHGGRALDAKLAELMEKKR
jgi:thiol-disulfide isomerase/thioredoxin